MTQNEWWRSAVIYQVYPRSFSDSDGDGLGDLKGIASRLPALRDLGIDAVWLSPFYTSPQNDAGYDVADYRDVDPRFGTLADFDDLIAEAHRLKLRVIVDLVPNHTSDQHSWFQAALAAPEGSPERARYLFRDGKGADGHIPPNNWESVFGGRAWTRVNRPDGTPGQWYLHLFDTSQPDLDWRNPWVREQFRGILRFWLDRGVDGFRVDVAHGLIKKAGLPDYTPPKGGASMGGHSNTPPYWAQPGVHEIYRDWRELIDEYPGDRVLVAEAWVNPLSELAHWVRPDEMHQAFNFQYLEAPWDAAEIRTVIKNSLAAFGHVGAPSTWVLSNHDVVRHASRLALDGDNPQGSGIGPNSPEKPNRVIGLRRARAATLLMLALPGSAYVYQGEELGLPEDVELPDSARQDPTWFRTDHERYGRDGCRVPIPWEAVAPAYGFSNTGKSWLPQPSDWAGYARDSQGGVAGSTLELYRSALALRAKQNLGEGELEWLRGYPHEVVAFRNGGVVVISNFGSEIIALPRGTVALSSEPITRELPGETTVWLMDDGR
ncbi:alpha-glucosidase [Cryobacterium mesophilum]|uniref:Alpha-amylase n=1 Tax=Terrimesophilobacter mesophilus TaxID=433647 RepID=A0A4R8VDB5_9MICO|nr:glycoside hydrolase family 13 protein [Terrimesophilobacter mesophilus]MBB5634011.1 alpha-glucosidase [Terrimesophilobacter mesophilus]TFB81361.1 alpha-amylase [Terrimesophilobacter mesophilus]